MGSPPLPDYSDFVRDDYGRPIPGAVATLYAIDGTTLIATATTDADGKFTVTGPDAKCVLQVSFGGASERSTVLVGNPPEYVGPSGPANSTFSTTTALAAAPSGNMSFLLAGTSRAGYFQQLTGDYTAQVANDPMRGIYIPASTDPTGASGVRKRVYDAAISVAWFGASGDGSDQTAAIQAAVNTGIDIFFPVGIYLLTAPIQLRPGQVVSGPTSGFQSADRAIVRNLQVGGGCFWYTLDGSTGDVRAPQIHNLYLTTDYPIRFNNENTAIVADSSGNVPALSRPVVRGCNIDARVQDTGRGIAFTKCFDGEIAFNRVTSFETDILLNGCDLCVVQNNRLLLAKFHHVLDLSIASFGSQNEISHNDILYANSTLGIFIKSTSRHARIYDNYMEQGTTMLCFIDLSNINAPNYNAQTPGLPLTAVVRDNRIDGQSYATGGVYRLQVGGRHYAEIVDVGTSGTPGTGLVLVDDSGATVDELPVRYNQLNGVAFHFRGPGFGKWDGFTTTQAPNMTIRPSNVGQFGLGLFTNNAKDFLRVKPSAISFKPGFGSVVDFSTVGMLEPNATYTAMFRMRTLSGTETVGIGAIVGGVGGTLSNVTVTTAAQTFSVGFKASASNSLSNGPYFNRSTNNGPVEIESITIAKAFDYSQDYTTGDTQTYTPTRSTGVISVQASDAASSVFVNAEYKFIGGKLAQIAKVADNAAQVDIAVSQSGGVVTFTLSGAASGKKLTFSHRYDT